MRSNDELAEIKTVADDGTGNVWCVLDCGDFVDLCLFEGDEGLQDGINAVLHWYPKAQVTGVFQQVDDKIVRWETPCP